jgi:solute carrier family 35, member F5
MASSFVNGHSGGISLHGFNDRNAGEKVTDKTNNDDNHNNYQKSGDDDDTRHPILNTTTSTTTQPMIPHELPSSGSTYCCWDVASLSSYTLGLVFIVIVAVIWSVSSIIVQYLYREQDFDAPFLLTYIGTSLFSVLLVFPYKPSLPVGASSDLEMDGGRSFLGVYQRVSQDLDDNQQGEEEDDVDDDAHQRYPDLSSHPVDTPNLVSKVWTDYDHRIAAAKIAPVWFISNFAYNTSLRYTSITSSTILVNTGSLFTFLFALLTKDEHFHIYKLLGVLFGMSGCILTGMHDASVFSSNDDDVHHTRIRSLLRLALTKDRTLLWQEQNDGNKTDDNPAWGDMLSLVSAVFYGVYAVMVRVLCPHDESLMSMKRFLGYIGLCNMLALSPIVIWQAIRNDSTPLSPFVFLCLIGKGLFDNVLSDYLWARAVVLTSATVATVGLGLTLPLAFVSDVAIGRPDVANLQSVLGATAVLTGFMLVNVGQQKDNENEDSSEAHHSAITIQLYEHPGDASTDTVLRQRQKTRSTLAEFAEAT